MGIYKQKKRWMWTYENGDHTRGPLSIADWDGRCSSSSRTAFSSEDAAKAALKRHVINACKFNRYPYNKENA